MLVVIILVHSIQVAKSFVGDVERMDDLETMQAMMTNKLPVYVVEWRWLKHSPGKYCPNHYWALIISALLKSDGGVLCWGNGKYGQLGNNASGDY